MVKTAASMTTDFIGAAGFAEKALELTAQAGFTHLHWCQHWSDDFIYTQPEIDYIGQLLEDNHLQLSDTHGSHGIEKCWYSPHEAKRQAGVELIRNRIDFTAQLNGDAVIVHGPGVHQAETLFEAELAALNRSLDELESYARDRNIKLALENSNENYEKLLLPTILSRSAEYMGFCYDCGHHNMKLGNETAEQRRRRDEMRNELAERLCIVHLQDNDGFRDRHWLPLSGEIDWQDVIGFLKLANYQKPLNLEVSYDSMNNHKAMTQSQFCHEAFQAVEKLTRLLQTHAK